LIIMMVTPTMVVALVRTRHNNSHHWEEMLPLGILNLNLPLATSRVGLGCPLALPIIIMEDPWKVVLPRPGLSDLIIIIPPSSSRHEDISICHNNNNNNNMPAAVRLLHLRARGS
jgi:hypothetical protein